MGNCGACVKKEFGIDVTDIGKRIDNGIEAHQKEKVKFEDDDDNDLENEDNVHKNRMTTQYTIQYNTHHYKREFSGEDSMNLKRNTEVETERGKSFKRRKVRPQQDSDVDIDKILKSKIFLN